MFIDDNPDDNFFHNRVIRKNNFAEKGIIKESAEEALKYLSEEHTEDTPQLIFLDINMPGMNGWEFMEAYEKLSPEPPPMLIILLTTSQSAIDKTQAKELSLISDFKTKPLTKNMMEEIIDQFSDRF